MASLAALYTLGRKAGADKVLFAMVKGNTTKAASTAGGRSKASITTVSCVWVLGYLEAVQESAGSSLSRPIKLCEVRHARYERRLDSWKVVYFAIAAVLLSDVAISYS